MLYSWAARYGSIHWESCRLIWSLSNALIEFRECVCKVRLKAHLFATRQRRLDLRTVYVIDTERHTDALSDRLKEGMQESRVRKQPELYLVCELTAQISSINQGYLR